MKKWKFTWFLIFVLFILYSSIPETAFGQAAPISMPDTVLASAVRAELGLAATALITDVAMLGLTALEATPLDPTDDKISDLTGLEHATNLTRLVLWGNSITDISPLSDLTNLTWLELTNNTISDVKAACQVDESNVVSISSGNSIRNLRPRLAKSDEPGNAFTTRSTIQVSDVRRA